jgi:NADH-quinone oxidoreductase subunit N
MGRFFQPQDLAAIGPELELALFGMIVLVFDLLLQNKRWLGYISMVGLAWSGYFLFRLRNIVAEPSYAAQLTAYGGQLALDPFAWFFKAIALVAAFLAVAISLKYLDTERENHGEYYALILFATMGIMFMVGALDLVTLYIGLETMAYRDLRPGGIPPRQPEVQRSID